MCRFIQRFIFLSALIVLCAALNASAQDAGMSEKDVTTVEKVPLITGEDMRYVPKATGIYAPADSISLQLNDFPMQRAAQKPGEKPAPKKDDSILTFNFLYYIIQKYKLQDIID